MAHLLHCMAFGPPDQSSHSTRSIEIFRGNIHAHEAMSRGTDCCYAVHLSKGPRRLQQWIVKSKLRGPGWRQQGWRQLIGVAFIRARPYSRACCDKPTGHPVRRMASEGWCVQFQPGHLAKRNRIQAYMGEKISPEKRGMLLWKHAFSEHEIARGTLLGETIRVTLGGNGCGSRFATGTLSLFLYLILYHFFH